MENKNAQPLSKVKIATIIAYLAIILALVFLYTNSPVTGYELSIYSSIPLFWGSIFVAISIATMLLVYQVYKKDYTNFFYILFILLLSFFVILTLPISREYFLYGSSDLMGHYNRIIDILNSGSIGDNYYPIVHILGAVILLFCKSDNPSIVVQIIPPIFSIIYVLFSYYLAKVVFKKEDYSVMAAVLSLIPLYSYYHVVLYPHAIAILLLPLIFYLYFNSKSPNYKILLTIMLVLQAFVHVIPTLIIFGCLCGAEIIKIIINRIKPSIKFNISFNSAAISLIVFFIWWSSYSVFGEMSKAYIWLVGESEAIPRAHEVANAVNLGQQNFIELFLKMYGNQFVLTIITLISIAVMVAYYRKRKEDISYGLVLSAILLISALIYILYFLTSGKATIGRFFGANYGVWAMPVISTFIFTIKDRNKIKLSIVSIVIIIILLLSMMNIYRSDWIYQPNWHVTKHDIFAKNWQSMHKSGSIVVGIIASPWGRVITPLDIQYGPYIPPHFGYDTNHQLGDFLYEDSLIYYGETRQKLVNKNQILNSSTLNNNWALPGFYNEDYIKLGNDRSVNFIYTNGEVRMLLVKSMKES
ncbi:MAG: hypothetical protein NC238_16180 [Dehalobacter sp.]|nr:hypothetical protein [Dehalobacter sp.]